MTEPLTPTQRARARKAARAAAISTAAIAMDTQAADRRERTGRTPPRWQVAERQLSDRERRVRAVLAALR